MAAEGHQLSLRGLPLGRLGMPEEVAKVIAFLASGAAASVTGSVWGIDGGSIRSLFFKPSNLPLSSGQNSPGRLTTMASCVCEDHHDGFVVRVRVFLPVGRKGRDPDEIARLRFQPHFLPVLTEHEHGMPGNHVDPRLGTAVVMVGGPGARRDMSAAHPDVFGADTFA